MNRRDLSARLLGAMFTGAGLTHFAKPDFFEAIVPRWCPNPRFANRASGVAEIVCGLGMVPRRTRRLAAFGLLGILAVVFPANVDMYLHDVDVAPDDDGRLERVEGVESTRTRNLARLPFQFLFAGLVWRHTRIPDAATQEHA